MAQNTGAIVTDRISVQAATAWEEVIQHWYDYMGALSTLRQTYRPELAALVNRALTRPEDAAIAFEVAKTLKSEEQQSLLPNLLALCSSGRYAHKAREMILAMPREWLLESIEAAAEETLRNNDFLDWVNILAVFDEIHPALAMRLARRAARHTDQDIRHWGGEFLSEHSNGDTPDDDLRP